MSYFNVLDIFGSLLGYFCSFVQCLFPIFFKRLVKL